MTLLSLFVFSCLMAVAKGLTRSHVASKELGWKLGEFVRGVDAAIGVGASTGVENVMLSGFQTQMAENNKVLVNPRVQEVIAYANKIVQNEVEKDYVCNREWSQQCPDGWLLVGDSCQAPQSYEGGCARLAFLAKASASKKQMFAKECKAPWPCSDSCVSGHDYDRHLCPTGWDEVDRGFCVRRDDSGLKMPCGNKYHFAGMGVAEKQVLTKTCGLEWPCVTSCKRNYSAACPDGWEASVEGMCLAPPTYMGDCSHGVNMSGFDFFQKVAFAKQCVAPFPCSGAKEEGDTDELSIPSVMENGPVDTGPGRIIDHNVAQNVKQHPNVSGSHVNIQHWAPDDSMPCGPVSDDGQITF